MRNSLIVAAFMGLAAAVSPAQAAWVFNSASTGGTNGTHANSAIATATFNSITVQARVTAWSINGNTVFDSFLGQYGGSGWGATSGDENGGNNTHAVDNQNRKDFLLVQFDRPMELVGGNFTTFLISGQSTKDSDATVMYGTTNLAWNVQPNLDGQNVSALNSLMNGGSFASNGGSAGGYRALGPGGLIGNIWLIGSSFQNPDSRIDSFKFGGLTMNVGIGVPEPGTWATMLAGFAFAGAALRRRRRVLASA